jgi:acetoin utilization deacetylase AcuC-like enzyme
MTDRRQLFRHAVQELRQRFTRHPATIWYSPKYRFPMPSLEAVTGMDARRADLVAWYLVARGVVPEKSFRTPLPISYSDMARVHSDAYLESLTDRDTLARIFASSSRDLPVDEVMHTARLACGATLAAARESLRTHEPAINLLGGFHHAGRDHGGGFCPVNDLAIAVATLRAEDFRGQVCVLDLDAHPPDGTAECLRDDSRAWIGSLSGGTWGDLDGVDETVVHDSGDKVYLEALDALLKRMPRPDLAFVNAGGDVLAGDRLGHVGLTMDGARARDLHVADALDGTPVVWLPAGGYSDESWRVLAGTALAVVRRSRVPIPKDYDPMRARFKFIATHLGEDDLSDRDKEDADIAAALGLRRSGPRRLLDYYTAEGLEYAFSRYGLLQHVARLGYQDFRVVLDSVDQGDRLRLYGHAAGRDHVLVEVVLERQRIDAADVLYVHWLTLRHPLAEFDERRPALPGQDAPGLGLAREIGEMLGRMAARLNLSGVAFRPAFFHMAYTARYRFRFNDPPRQARFEALIRDFRAHPLLETTLAIAERRVLLNGAPYVWEADLMISWLKWEDHPAPKPADVGSWHFTLAPAVTAPAPPVPV